MNTSLKKCLIKDFKLNLYKTFFNLWNSNIFLKNGNVLNKLPVTNITEALSRVLDRRLNSHVSCYIVTVQFAQVVCRRCKQQQRYLSACARVWDFWGQNKNTKTKQLQWTFALVLIKLIEIAHVANCTLYILYIEIKINKRNVNGFHTYQSLNLAMFCLYRFPVQIEALQLDFIMITA